MGGILISQQHSPVLLVSVFNDSDQKYIPIDKFFGEIAGQINKKIELKYVSIISDPDKKSGKFEAEGPYHDSSFYVFGRALRTDDKIYLIHYPNFNPKTTKNISEEIDQIYNSINIFPACKI